MPLPLRLLLLVTLLENAASAMIQNGIYFYTDKRLAFTAMENLGLAVLHGATYIAGALISHPISARFGEKRTLLAVLLLQMGVTLGLALRPDALGVWAVSPVLLALYGVKWPIVETYIVAGRTPRQTTTALGKFNVTWSSAVALSGTFAGALIAWGAAPLFVASAASTVFSVLICAFILPREVAHLPHDHPERPDVANAARYGRLLASTRWTMLTTYALGRVAMPLMPTIMASFGVGVVAATPLAMLASWSRSAAFAVLGAWPGWHGGRKLPALAALLVPVAAMLMLEGPVLWVVLAALLLFGILEGIAYTASLYYAMVLKNAAVDAGGAHEAVIGSGFVVGPAVGLGAQKASALITPAWLGMTLGLSPLFLVGLVAGLWPLREPKASPQTE